MRHGRAYRVDTVHAEIRDGLRLLGCSVLDTSQHAGGFPDLVVGLRGATYLVECKTPRKQGGRGEGETRAQLSERERWVGGPWLVCTSLLHAAQELGLQRELVDRMAIRVTRAAP